MLKEIAEQPRAVADTLLGRLADGTLLLDEMRLSDQELRDIDKIIIIACGTAYHSGLIAKYAVEHWTRIRARSSWPRSSATATPSSTGRLVVAISQSGETMDTLMAVRHARSRIAGARHL